MKNSLKLDKIRSFRISTLLLVDIILINVSVLFSLLLRHEFSLTMLRESLHVQGYLRIALPYTLITLLIFACFHLYRSLWEYAGADELGNIILATIASNVVQIPLCLMMKIALPRSLPIINSLVMMAAVGAFRYTYRYARKLRNQFEQERRPTMLIGAGASGALVLRDLTNSGRSQNRVVCVIDDDVSKHGTFLMGVKVAGGRDLIPEMAEKFGITDIILAIPTATAKEKREIVAICQKTNCKLQILPGIYQLASGQVNVQALRDVQVEDLLGREKVQVDSSEIERALAGKVIMVTGGGGSIGSELCRQISQYPIKQLIIFDIYENNAYEIQQELKRKYPHLDLVVLIGSVRDEKRVNEVFDCYRPDMVCHAAAHKHVPLMEDSPAEAIKNNVFGTYNVAKAADYYGAASFTLISSDKAVNPTNIMGASKRICEMIVQTMGKTSKTRFAAVRFGNVLGSNGSVIPLFKRQIAEGGPVTVTHKDIIRYFMTISEAVSLVLQACMYAQNGEVFVLDMGDPVRIDDLARNMIRLSGLEPDVDIEIRYTGLRPGEKLFEELLMQDEGLDKTPNDLIFIGHFNDFDKDQLIASLLELKQMCQEDPENIRDVVRQLVTTYRTAEHEENAVGV